MLSAASGLSAAEILLRHDKPLADSAVATLESFIARRARREPLQHILGESFFMGMRFKVSPAVLIPRPETEVLAEQALKVINEKFGGRARMLDIGAGSGAICLSLLQLCPGSTAQALEISPEAAALCLFNASDLQVADRLKLYTADFLAHAPDLSAIFGHHRFEIFLSNPPYIQKDAIDSLDPEVKNYEPRLALVGPGDDGLGFYRAFARHLPAIATSEESIILCEFGQGQGEEIKTIFDQANWQDVSLLPDLSGMQRILMARCPKLTL